jgi:hypothetical protein
LGFIDSLNESPTGSLKALVDVQEDTDEERRILAELLQAKYPRVFDINLKTATPGALAESIGSYGATGATRKRAVRFFIKAATHAHVPLSTRLTANLRERMTTEAETEGINESGEPTKQQPPKQARRKKRQTTPPTEGGRTQNNVTANAMKTINLPAVGGTLTLNASFNPLQLKGDERTLVYLIVDKMDEFEQKTKTVSE